ncbi:rhomboid family GlyGly-CTERM serine protease [Fluviicoccus keumensis]|uniref:Rhomboid family GlyGly-CTERM serine protease n=2 Tax=Fluviicoccus keumensis TaxID=1435465 RepID=A0A4Q7YN52_9GAMM|nr:rhomboid family GlyGly-CTERM serine protease [Fluviicoccus keumensis]
MLRDHKPKWALAGLVVMMFAMQAHGLAHWSWSRPEIAAGEWWRWFTGHYVHLGLRHLLINVLGLLVLTKLFEGVLHPRHWVCLLVLLPMMISSAFWWRLPGLSTYVGLSGVLHGAYVSGAILMAAGRTERWTGLLLLGLGLAKLGTEGISGESAATGVWIGGPVLMESHQLGALAGGGLALFWLLFGLTRARQATKLVP